MHNNFSSKVAHISRTLNTHIASLLVKKDKLVKCKKNNLNCSLTHKISNTNRDVKTKQNYHNHRSYGKCSKNLYSKILILKRKIPKKATNFAKGDN